MKLHLPNRLRAALLAVLALGVLSPAAAADAKTLHLYVLTGQSNSLGAVKGDPLPTDMLQAYSTATAADADGILMWNGNMSGSVSANEPSKNLVVPDEGKTWQTIAPQLPSYTNNCMGPEFGFAHMMQRKGWNVGTGDDIAVIKASRDGGGNDQWVKGQSLYNLLLNSVMTALSRADAGYTTLQLDGLMYLQGESNGTAAGADTKFQQFVRDLRSDISAQLATEAYSGLAGRVTVKLGETVVGEPASWGSQGNGTVNATASALYGMAQSTDGTGYVFTRDLDKITSGDSMGVHYDGGSQLTIGARYAYAMAAEQNLDLTDGGTVRVRSQEYGDTFSAGGANDFNAREPIYLNEARAWWRNAEEAKSWTTDSLRDVTAVWDLSSANMKNTAQGGELLSGDLALGGIRIEDPYAEDDTTGMHNATIRIAAKAGTDAVLGIGKGGIEVQHGNLSLQSKIRTDAAQTWSVAGGKQLSIGNDIAGSGTIRLTRGGSGEGTPLFDFSSASDSGSHAWVLGDGVQVALSETGFSGSALSVEDGSTASLSGSSATIASLALGTGSALKLDNALQLHTGTLELGSAVSLGMSCTGNTVSALHADSISAAEGSRVTLQFGTLISDGSGERILGSGWSGWSTDGTGSRTIAMEGAPAGGIALSVNQAGQLVLTGSASFIGAGHTVSKSQLSGGTYELTGSGTYALGTVNTVGDIALGSGISLSHEGWTGSVLLTNGGVGGSAYGTAAITDTALNALTADAPGSWVEFQAFRGYFSQKAHDVTANIRLTGANALQIAAGNSTGQSITFSGKVAGDGTLNYAYNGASVTFSGDISAWEGAFEKNNGAGSSVTELQFRGEATDINAAVRNNGGSGLNVSFGTIADGKDGYTFSKEVKASTVTVNGNKVSFKDNLTADNLKLDGKATVDICGTDSKVGTLGVANGGQTDAAVRLNVKEGAVLTVTGTGDSVVFAAQGEMLTVEKDGKFIVNSKGLTVESVDGQKTASFGVTDDAYNGSGVFTYRYNNSGYTATDAKLSFAVNSNQTIGSKLVGSDLVNNGTGTLTLNHAQNSLHGLDAVKGSIIVANAGSGVKNLASLGIGNGQSVSFYTGTVAAEDQEATLCVTTLISAGLGSTLNANLKLGEGVLLDFADTQNGLTLGSTLTLGSGITLTETMVNTLHETGELVLFSGVDALTLGTESYTGSLDGTIAADFISGLGQGYLLTYSGAANGGIVSIKAPEPATATLSLLALAALAARRKRK